MPVENAEQTQEVLLLRDVPDTRLKVRPEPSLRLRKKRLPHPFAVRAASLRIHAIFTSRRTIENVTVKVLQ